MRRAIIPLIALALASFANQAAAEQGQWQPRLTLYPGQFHNIAFASATTVWAAGPGGVLLSEDGGGSWRWTLNTPLRVADSARDGLHGWAVGPGGVIFATSDGGRTWNAQQSGTSIDLFAVGALDSQHVIATGYQFSPGQPQPVSASILLRTEDGGLTWQEAQLPGEYELRSLAVLPGSESVWLFAIKCPSGQAASGCTGEMVLLTSDDAGKTWEETDSGQQLWGMQLTSPSRGWAIGESGLLRTENGGKSWVVIQQWPDTMFVGNLSVLSDDSVALLVTDNTASTQQIVKTDDAGADWSNVGGATWTISQLRYFDETHAVRAKWDQTIERSKDGGATWHSSVAPAFATLIRPGFDFVDPMNGWLAATKLLRTRDAGQSWEAVSDRQFDVVDFVSPTEGWAAQTDCAAGPCKGVVLHSVDGGATWEEQIRREASDVPRVTFVDRLNGWVTLGSDEPVLHTRNGGVTWTERQPPGRNLIFVDAATVWAAEDVTLFISTDGGDTWSQAAFLTGAQGCGLAGIAASDAQHVWVAAYDCAGQRPGTFLERSVDGGGHWEQLSPPVVGQFHLLTFFNSLDGIAVRAVCSAAQVNVPCDEVVITTRDGGLTWSSDPTPFHGFYFEDFQFTDLWRGWLSETTGGGQTELLKQVLYSYSTTPASSPVTLPTTGQERRGDSPKAPLAALGALGVVLVGAGGIVGLRRRRRDG